VRLLRLLVCGLVVLLVIMPAVLFASAPMQQQLPHHASMKASRSSPGGGRTMATSPTLVAFLPIFVPYDVAIPWTQQRLLSIDPAVPFVPPRG